MAISTAIGLSGMHDPYDPRYYSVDPSKYSQLQTPQEMLRQQYMQDAALTQFQASQAKITVTPTPTPNKTLLLLGE